MNIYWMQRMHKSECGNWTEVEVHAFRHGEHGNVLTRKGKVNRRANDSPVAARKIAAGFRDVLERELLR